MSSFIPYKNRGLPQGSDGLFGPNGSLAQAAWARETFKRLGALSRLGEFPDAEQSAKYESEWGRVQNIDQEIDEVERLIKYWRSRGGDTSTLYEILQAFQKQKVQSAEALSGRHTQGAARETSNVLPNVLRIASMEIPDDFRSLGGGFYRQGHVIWELRAAEDSDGGYVLTRKREERAVDLREATREAKTAGAGASTSTSANGCLSCRGTRRARSLYPAVTAMAAPAGTRLTVGSPALFIRNGQASPVVVINVNQKDETAEVQDDQGDSFESPLDMLLPLLMSLPMESQQHSMQPEQMLQPEQEQPPSMSIMELVEPGMQPGMQAPMPDMQMLGPQNEQTPMDMLEQQTPAPFGCDCQMGCKCPCHNDYQERHEQDDFGADGVDYSDDNDYASSEDGDVPGGDAGDAQDYNDVVRGDVEGWEPEIEPTSKAEVDGNGDGNLNAEPSGMTGPMDGPVGGPIGEIELEVEDEPDDRADSPAHDEAHDGQKTMPGVKSPTPTKEEKKSSPPFGAKSDDNESDSKPADKAEAKDDNESADKAESNDDSEDDDEEDSHPAVKAELKKLRAIRTAFRIRAKEVNQMFGQMVAPMKAFSPVYMGGEYSFDPENRDVYEVEGFFKADPHRDHAFGVPNPVVPYPDATGGEQTLNDRIKLRPQGGGDIIFVTPEELEEYFDVQGKANAPTGDRNAPYDASRPVDQVPEMPGEWMPPGETMSTTETHAPTLLSTRPMSRQDSPLYNRPPIDPNYTPPKPARPTTPARRVAPERTISNRRSPAAPATSPTPGALRVPKPR